VLIEQVNAYLMKSTAVLINYVLRYSTYIHHSFLGLLLMASKLVTGGPLLPTGTVVRDNYWGNRNPTGKYRILLAFPGITTI
jgi:hypothetical protein